MTERQRAARVAPAALVTVFGKAGNGKTRLAWEFAKYVEEFPQISYQRRGRCLVSGDRALGRLRHGRGGPAPSDQLGPGDTEAIPLRLALGN